MMNLEKMKQKKSKNSVKKGLLAATTFLCLTTPLLDVYKRQKQNKQKRKRTGKAQEEAGTGSQETEKHSYNCTAEYLSLIHIFRYLWVCWKSILLQPKCCTNRRRKQSMSKMEYMPVDCLPVSYTHLDVYKRQGHYNRTGMEGQEWRSYMYRLSLSGWPQIGRAHV